MFYEIEREIKFVFLVWPGVHYWFDPNNATPIYFYFYVTLWYQVKYWTPLTCLGREMVKSHELLLSLSRMGKSSSAWATRYRKRKNGLYTDNFSLNISSKKNMDILFDGLAWRGNCNFSSIFPHSTARAS